jgi:hypothetical protein
MYPVTFYEFLQTQGEDLLLQQIKKAGVAKPMSELLHVKALGLLKTYLCIGGMPEAVATYLATKDLLASQRILSTIVTNYEDDFAKYQKNLSIEDLRETFRSAAAQAGRKFIYSLAYRDASSKTVHKALDLLVKAALVHKVYHSAGNGVPLGAEVTLNKFKTLPSDIAIFNRLHGLQLSDLALLDPLTLINKGSLAETYCGLELLSSSEPDSQPSLYYWQREAKNSNAEVDYIFSLNSKIYPIEVKASRKGAMQSMRLFLEEKQQTLGVRVSTENFSQLKDCVIIPLYAVPEIKRVVSELTMRDRRT